MVRKPPRWPLWVSVGSVIVVPSCPLGLNGPVLVPDHSRDQEHATWGRHTEQAKECNDFGSTEVGEVTGGRETQQTFEGIPEK